MSRRSTPNDIGDSVGAGTLQLKIQTVNTEYDNYNKSMRQKRKWFTKWEGLIVSIETGWFGVQL